MTGDERDRILGLLNAGPATVARLVDALGLPGGVVSYQLKLLERDGLVRAGTMRTEHSAATTVWVGTAAAAAPPILAPDPLPGLTWVGDDSYPIPVWTAPHPPAAEDPDADSGPSAETARRPGRPAPADTASGRATGDPGPTGWPRPDESRGADSQAARPGEPRPPTQTRSTQTQSTQTRSAQTQSAQTRSAREETTRARSATTPQSRRPVPDDAEPDRGPRLLEVRRLPIDDATFYEFAGRLDALAREFAARAVPGAPATELTIALTRPAAGRAGHGS